jgi:outer membrane lipoprotein-sorting protein
LLRHESKYSVSVTSEGYETPQVLKIAIKGSDDENKNYENPQNVSLENGKTQKIITYDVRQLRIICISQ